MKQGMPSLDALRAEVYRQTAAKKDYLASTQLLRVSTDRVGAAHTTNLDFRVQVTQADGTKVWMAVSLPINEMGHKQIRDYLGERADLGAKYYQTIRRLYPELLDFTINYLFSKAPDGEQRTVRTLDGEVRAFLSNGYRRLDHIDLVRHLLPVLDEFPDVQVQSCNLTERGLYIKFTLPSLRRWVLGQAIDFGGILENSEVGLVRWSILPFSMVLDSMGGMKHTEWGQKRTHVGKRQSTTDAEGVEELLTDTTRALEDAALYSAGQDILRAILRGDVADRIVARMEEKAGVQLARPEQAIQILADRNGLTEEERQWALGYMIEQGDRSAFGLAHAISLVAGDVGDYDRATELEALSGKIIDLPMDDIRALSGNDPASTFGKRSRKAEQMVALTAFDD